MAEGLRPFLRPYRVLLAGVLLVVAGVLVWMLTRVRGPESFGWYGYSLDGEAPRYADYLPGGPFARGGSGWDVVALVLGAAGVALTAGGAGYRLGARRAAFGPGGGTSSAGGEKAAD